MRNMKKQIPHNRPWITQRDRDAIEAALGSGWIAGGTQVKNLESNFELSAKKDGRACAVSSGTAALFMVLYCLGIRSGSSVVVPTYACSALLNAVFMTGADAIIVDVEPESFNIDLNSLSQINIPPDAVVAVNTFGEPSPTKELLEQELTVIEDCCQSLGGLDRDGDLLGTQSHVSIFSFYATKIITGGHGGMIWTDDQLLGEAIHDYREFDCRKNYKQRFNFQLTDIQASMINNQFQRLSEIVKRRYEIAARYTQVLPSGFKLQKGVNRPGRIVYRYVLIAHNEATRDDFQRYLGQCGIKSIVPVERYELLHNYLDMDHEKFPVAELLARTTLSIPLYPSLSECEIDHICDSLAAFK